MVYKDKDKQREANRQAQARFKAKAKGITEGITEPGITLPEQTDLGNTLTTTQTVGASKSKRRKVIHKGSAMGLTVLAVLAALPKRGKDIKVFEDLHPETQARIRDISDTNEEFKRRTAIAIQYQHIYPDRYEPKGITQRHKVDKAEDRAGKVEPCMRPGYVCPIPEDQRKPGINYGPYMTALELEMAGLKANRVSVPGDEDYEGVCKND